MLNLVARLRSLSLSATISKFNGAQSSLLALCFNITLTFQVWWRRALVPFNVAIVVGRGADNDSEVCLCGSLGSLLWGLNGSRVGSHKGQQLRYCMSINMIRTSQGSGSTEDWGLY